MPFNINDPLLQALLASIAQGTASPPSNPDIFMNPQGVWQNRPAVPNMPNADPLDQQLANKPNILEGDYMSQQYYADLEQQKKLRDMASIQAAQNQKEIEKAAILKKLELAAAETKGEAERKAKLEEAFIRGMSEIYKPGDMRDPAAQEALAQAFSNRYQMLSQATAMAPVAGTSQDAIKVKVDEWRKTMTDEQIRAQLSKDVAANPRGAGAAQMVLDYMASAKPVVPKPTTPAQTKKPEVIANTNTSYFMTPPESEQIQLPQRGVSPLENVAEQVRRVEKEKGPTGAIELLKVLMPILTAEDRRALIYSLPNYRAIIEGKN